MVSAFPHMMSLIHDGSTEETLPMIRERQYINSTVGLTRKHFEWKPPGSGDGMWHTSPENFVSSMLTRPQSDHPVQL